VVDAQEIEDGQMLARLGHRSLIGSDDQHGGIGTAGARQHVPEKILMTWHVHEARLVPAGKIHPGETGDDGQAARFLFG